MNCSVSVILFFAIALDTAFFKCRGYRPHPDLFTSTQPVSGSNSSAGTSSGVSSCEHYAGGGRSGQGEKSAKRARVCADFRASRAPSSARPWRSCRGHLTLFANGMAGKRITSAGPLQAMHSPPLMLPVQRGKCPPPGRAAARRAEGGGLPRCPFLPCGGCPCG
mgnify:CR=1 FL=1